MTKYACKHECDTIIMDTNVLSMSAFFDWKDSVGWNGDKSMCWECYCKKYPNGRELR